MRFFSFSRAFFGEPFFTEKNCPGKPHKDRVGYDHIQHPVPDNMLQQEALGMLEAKGGVFPDNRMRIAHAISKLLGDQVAQSPAVIVGHMDAASRKGRHCSRRIPHQNDLAV